MKALRLVLALVLVGSVVLDGLRGLVVGIAVVVVVELITLRARLADSAARDFSRARGRRSRVPLWRRMFYGVAARLGASRHAPEPFPGLGIGVYRFESLRDFDVMLRPRLSAAAAAALADRHGVDLGAEPDRASRLLGDEVWWLLDPGRPASDDHRTFGHRQLEQVVSAIERL